MPVQTPYPTTLTSLQSCSGRGRVWTLFLIVDAAPVSCSYFVVLYLLSHIDILLQSDLASGSTMIVSCICLSLAPFNLSHPLKLASITSCPLDMLSLIMISFDCLLPWMALRDVPFSLSPALYDL